MAPNVAAFKKFPIVTKQGQVFLEDVANVEDGASIQTSRVRIDGKPQVYVPIYRQGGASSLAVSNEVQKQVPAMEDKLARIAKATGLAGKTTLKFVMDQAVYVREAIESLIHEGVIGAILVAIMILIFLGNWRMTVIATISIPVSLLGAIIGIYVTGNTINVMTLGGLALAIGPLVDDAIVALENTHRNYSLGKSRVRSALDGAIEVMVPVLVATCTTCIVLAPLALMPGMGGFLFRPLAIGRGLCDGHVVRAFAELRADDVREISAGRTWTREAIHGRATNIPTAECSAAIHHRIEAFLGADDASLHAAAGMVVGPSADGADGRRAAVRRFARSRAVDRPRILSGGRRRPDHDVCPLPFATTGSIRPSSTSPRSKNSSKPTSRPTSGR